MYFEVFWKAIYLFMIISRESNLFLTQEADGILGLGVNTNCKRIKKIY